MKFGICTSVDNLKLLEKTGYDYIELPLNHVATIPAEDFEKICGEVDASSLKAERFSLLYPKTMALIGPRVASIAEQEDYLHTAYSRARRLGGEVVVFGSGKSRMVPDGFSFSQGFQQLVQVTSLAGKLAGEYGIRVAIEPLNRKECNIIHTVMEGALLQGAVGMASVGVLADYFHMYQEQEPMENILTVDALLHTHIATGADRLYPCSPTEDIISFFSALKQKGYDGSMSIEGKTQDMTQDAPRALEVLRSLAG